MDKKSLIDCWENYCSNSTVHGLRYLGERSLTWTEKIIWLIVMALAFWGIIFVSLMIQKKFDESLLSTVVETTNYHISEVSFPAVTLCNHHRVNFDKFESAVERFLPNTTTENRDTFLVLLKALEVLDFGSFDELEDLLGRDIHDLAYLNLKDVVAFMSYTCKDLFMRCWWRNQYLPCCDIFTVQWSEYGSCYSFNSATSAPSSEVNRSFAWPWRVSSFNEWSALRVEIKVQQSKYYNETRPMGVLFIVHDPYEWPNIARFIPTGSNSGVRISATNFYASNDVHKLPIKQRQCVYNEERIGQKLMYLEGLPYQRANCISQCRQVHMVKFCNCSMDLFFPDQDNNPICDLTSFACLNEFNDIFNYEVPQKQNEFFNEDEHGMLCDCLPECDRIQYTTEVQSDLAMSKKTKDMVTLDFHFGSGEMVRYRTDITFGWLELMVSFGGVAGLFLGCSLLSGVEMIYYLTVGLFYQTKRVAQSAKSRISAAAGGGRGVDQDSRQLPTQKRIRDNDDQSGGRPEMRRKRNLRAIISGGRILGNKWRQVDRYNVKEMQQGIGANAKEWGYHKWTMERDRY